MYRRLLALILPLPALLVGACRPPAYVQPEAHEPHAVLKIRHVVHAMRGREYGSTARLGEFSIDERTLDPGQEDSATVHLRVRPETAQFGVRGASFHTEMRQVQRYRTVQEPYTCYQQQCSYGGKSGTTCRSVSNTCYRSRQESYWVTEAVRVVDDECGRSTSFAPRPGGVYLLQFDYLGENDCKLACFEQVPQRDGTFELSPCSPLDSRGAYR